MFPGRRFSYGAHQVTIETGRLARQADGSVVVTMGDTVVLVTAVGRARQSPGRDFFPLTVNYVEKTYAAGKIPGGFFKREGRPSEKEVLTSRLIDRPLRPLFPEGFYNEVQIVATVLSLDPEIDSDIPSLIGASAAVALSGIPFTAPIAAARVGYKDGQYLLNPTSTQVKTESRPGSRRRRHGRGRADGRVGSQGPVRGSHARRRAVRPRADADRGRRDQQARRRGRQAALGLEAGGAERRARSRRSPSSPRRTTPRPTDSSSSRRASRASPRSARPRRPSCPAATSRSSPRTRSRPSCTISNTASCAT